MSYSLSHKFDPKDQLIANICKTLSHPARICILRSLAQHQDTPVPFAAFEEILPLKQPTISQHISQLKKLNIIKSQQMGSNTSFSLNTSNKSIFALVSFLINKNFVDENDIMT